VSISTPEKRAKLPQSMDASGRRESMVAGYGEIPCDIPFTAAWISKPTKI
jgi:hypothetical protein